MEVPGHLQIGCVLIDVLICDREDCGLIEHVCMYVCICQYSQNKLMILGRDTYILYINTTSIAILLSLYSLSGNLRHVTSALSVTGMEACWQDDQDLCDVRSDSSLLRQT